MTKIKTFTFKVSSSMRSSTPKEEYLLYLSNPDLIDDTINDFIKDKNVIDIKINTYTSHRHNNAGSDEVLMAYTIIYSEP